MQSDYDYTEQLVRRQTSLLHELEDAAGISRDRQGRAYDVPMNTELLDNVWFWTIVALGCACWGISFYLAWGGA